MCAKKVIIGSDGNIIRDNPKINHSDSSFEKNKSSNPERCIDYRDDSGEYLVSISESGSAMIVLCTECSETLTIPTNIRVDGMTYNVESIDGEAFFGLHTLKRLTVPEGVKNLKGLCVYDSLESISLPSSIEHISISNDGGTLREINVAEGNNRYRSEDGVLFTADGTVLLQYPWAKEQNEYSIPDGVRYIRYGAFDYANNLRSLYIPDSVLAIDSGTFLLCDNLKHVSIPSDLFHDNVFWNYDPDIGSPVNVEFRHRRNPWYDYSDW